MNATRLHVLSSGIWSLTSAVVLAVIMYLAASSLAGAAVTNDRDYRFGGTGSADASLGANVGRRQPNRLPV